MFPREEIMRQFMGCKNNKKRYGKRKSLVYQSRLFQYIYAFIERPDRKSRQKGEDEKKDMDIRQPFHSIILPFRS